MIQISVFTRRPEFLHLYSDFNFIIAEVALHKEGEVWKCCFHTLLISRRCAILGDCEQ